MASIYNKAVVKVQKKSGFDKSFQNLFTSKVGTITPILTDELIPNTTVNLRMAISTQLPPLASDTFMRVKQKYAAFFVPTRIIMPGFESWLCGSTNKSPVNPNAAKVRTPTIVTTTASTVPGSLADYLGHKQESTTGTNITVEFNALPFLAYHKIYDDWFRNSLVQKPIYAEEVIAGNVDYRASNSNHVVPCSHSGDAHNYRIDAAPKSGGPATVDSAHSPLYADGVSILSLRQANFGSDLYTSCTPQPQNGQAQSVSFTTAAEGQDSSFTISALRAANSMQQFIERNNLGGNRLVDYVKAQYGANLNDAIAQRSVLLGSGSFDVYSKGVYQTAETDTSVASDIVYQNPFRATPGAKYGSAYVDGQDLVIKGFTAMEPGYLMVVTWLSPKVTYSTGTDPILTRYIKSANTQSDMANPILQNVGNEPIYARQLNIAQINSEAVFGYNDRYANWKDKTDEVHGLLRDQSSLQSFALQRSFNGTVSISDSFLKIPTNYMDQVASVDTQISEYGYWCDTYFDYKVSMPLATYSVPSLQDPAYEHGQDVVVDRGGKQLN